MKTFPEYFQDSIDMTDGSVTITEKDYKAIQLDAYEKGIRDAAEIAFPEKLNIDFFVGRARIQYEQRSETRRAILSLLTKPKDKE